MKMELPENRRRLLIMLVVGVILIAAGYLYMNRKDGGDKETTPPTETGVPEPGPGDNGNGESNPVMQEIDTITAALINAQRACEQASAPVTQLAEVFNGKPKTEKDLISQAKAATQVCTQAQNGLADVATGMSAEAQAVDSLNDAALASVTVVEKRIKATKSLIASLKKAKSQSADKKAAKKFHGQALKLNDDAAMAEQQLITVRTNVGLSPDISVPSDAPPEEQPPAENPEETTE